MGTCLILTEPLHPIYHPSLFHLKFTSSSGCKPRTVENKPKEKNCPCLNLSASVPLSNGWALHVCSSHHYSHQKGGCLPLLPAVSPSFVRGSLQLCLLSLGWRSALGSTRANVHNLTLKLSPEAASVQAGISPQGSWFSKEEFLCYQDTFFERWAPFFSVILLQFWLTWELHRDDI